jgi:hypothetical protein
VPLAARPEITGRKMGPSLLLPGYDDNDTISREALARAWETTVRTIRNYQYQVDDPLPFIVVNNRVSHIVGSVRQWLRCRERHLNRNRRHRGD